MKSRKFTEILLRHTFESLTKKVDNNFDYYRFSKQPRKSFNLKGFVKEILYKEYTHNRKIQATLSKLDNILDEYGERLNLLYNALSDKYSKELLVELVVYRILGFQHVKLSRNTEYYWKILSEIEKLKNENDYLDIEFNKWRLNYFDLDQLGLSMKIYHRPPGILHEFVLEQYKYHQGDVKVSSKKGDYVLDIGGCWGDTALYFANKSGKDGKVFSFEFIPGNLKIFKKNLSLNPELAPIVDIVESPVSDKSNVKIYYYDQGPGSKLSYAPFDKAEGETNTISIDDFVDRSNIERVDYIKMDIEGSELPALKGAVNTIKKFRPKLAIAIYHSLDDFVDIPLWIYNLGEGYELYLDHFTIHREETVLFAIPTKENDSCY